MTISLNATTRDDMGKGASRRLRHANKLPAIIYGAGKDPLNITLEQKDVQHQLHDETFYTQVLSLSVDGSAEDVLLKDLQHHPYKMDIMHMDFQRVDANKVVHVNIPLHFEGEEEAPGVKLEGGAVSHIMTDVEVVCLPANIPEYITVDISAMQTDDILHLTDLKMPEGVEIAALKHNDDHDAAIVSIHARKAVEEIDEAAPEAPESEDEAEEGGEE